MFVHLIQFEVTDGLDLGLLDEGAALPWVWAGLAGSGLGSLEVLENIQ